MGEAPKIQTTNFFYGVQLVKKGRWGKQDIFYKMFENKQNREKYLDKYIYKNPINGNKVLKINRFQASIFFE